MRRARYILSALLLPTLAVAQTVVDILPAPSSAWGLAYEDGFLWVGEDGDGFIRKVDPADGTILGTIGTPYDTNHIAFGANHGVAWDGAAFWVAGDFGKDWLYRVDMAGTTLDSIPTPTDAVGGLAWDGTQLLVSSYFPNAGAAILVVDSSSGAVTDTIPVQGTQPYGVVFDGGTASVWNSMDDNDGDPERVWQLAVSDGAVLASFDSPAQSPKGVALGDGHLWLVANTIGGAGRRIYKIDLAGAGTPDITATPTSQDFGIVPTGTSPSLMQTLTNDGDGDLVITSVSTTAPFSTSVLALPDTLGPAEQLVFDVVYSPTVAGNDAANVTVTSNDVDEGTLDIPVSGVAVPPDPTISVTPSALDFADTGVGLVRGLSLTIENVGAANLTVTNVTSDDAAFQLPLVSVPHVLSTFETLSITIVFAPTVVAGYAGTIAISSNDPVNGVVNRAASGDGIDVTFAGGDVIWSAPGIENVVTVFAHADLNGDGIPDAVMESYDAGASGDPFQSFWGNSHGAGVSIWSTGAGTSGGWGDFCVASLGADFDSDGVDDLVRGTAWGGRSVEVRGADDGDILWSFDTVVHGGGGWVYDVSSMPDVSGDGFPEVLAAAGTNGGAGTGPRRVYCFDGMTGAIRYSFIGPDAFLTVDWIEDVNTDGVPDVIAGAGGNGADDRVVCLSGASTGSGTLVWQFPTGGSVWSVSSIADVTGDGVDEVLAGSTSNDVYCLNGATGTVVWQRAMGGDVLRVEAMNDVTGDGRPDVVAAQLGTSFRVLDGFDGTVQWTYPTGGNVWSASSISDVNGDGLDDCIAGSQNDLVHCVSGADGALLWSADVGALVFSVRAIGDVNGNGVADVLVGTQYLDPVGGEIFCLEGDGTIVDVAEPLAGLAPGAVRFVGARPNPLPGRGAFHFDAGSRARGTVTIDVFDVSGRLVRTLHHAVRPGPNVVVWDGDSRDRRPAANGVYVYRIAGPAGSTEPVRSGKLTLLR